MLTKDDLKDVFREQWERIREAFSHLPTKEEFFAKMDELMKEVKDFREEQKVLVGQLSEHSDTLDDHETRLGKVEKTLAISSN